MSNPESLTLKVVQKSDPEQFDIESNHHEAEGEWRDIYVSFGGYFGKFGPHMFAAAPALLEALEEAENALADYIPTIERTGASLNYGHSVLKKARAAIDAARQGEGGAE